MNTLKKLTFFIFLFSNGFASAGLFDIDGTVFDEQTKQPIQGVYVKAEWKVCIGIGHCNTFCGHMEIKKTDENGEYSMPKWHRGNLRLDAYKDGYEYSRMHDDDVYMKKIKVDNIEQRLRYIDRLGSGCRGWMEAERFLAPLSRAIYDEASRIAVTAKESVRHGLWVYFK